MTALDDPEDDIPTKRDSPQPLAIGRFTSAVLDLTARECDAISTLLLNWRNCTTDRRVLIEALARELAKIDPAVV